MLRMLLLYPRSNPRARARAHAQAVQAIYTHHRRTHACIEGWLAGSERHRRTVGLNWLFGGQHTHLAYVTHVVEENISLPVDDLATWTTISTHPTWETNVHLARQVVHGHAAGPVPLLQDVGGYSRRQAAEWARVIPAHFFMFRGD